jgi:imidazolonepropionase-like amidohydrolase
MRYATFLDTVADAAGITPEQAQRAVAEARQLGPDLAGHTERGDQLVYVSGGELGLRRERINEQFVTRG